MEPHSVEVFPFLFDCRYQLAGLPFGITPATTGVRVTDSDVLVQFGFWRLRTRRENIVSTVVTGPYALLTTLGPPHVSLSDRGLSCITNSRRGVCLSFATPVAGIEPLGLLKHPGLTATVAECDRLVAALA